MMLSRDEMIDVIADRWTNEDPENMSRLGFYKIVAGGVVDALTEAGAFTPDQPAEPDEDAAVGNVTAIDYIVRQHYPSALAIAQALHTAGYTRRPVDTRPTMTVSEFVEGWNANHRRSWSIERNDSPTVDVMLALGLITPDPAPAAEVPVVEVPADKLLFAVNQLRGYSRSEGGLMYTDALADDLEAALTKATDR